MMDYSNFPLHQEREAKFIENEPANIKFSITRTVKINTKILHIIITRGFNYNLDFSFLNNLLNKRNIDNKKKILKILTIMKMIIMTVTIIVTMIIIIMTIIFHE